MSYTKKTWAAGQKVKSADLNNMEGGIDVAANPFVVTLTPTAEDFSGTMDKTPSEIDAAIQNGRRILFNITGMGASVECSQFKVSNSLYTAHANIIYNPGTGDLLMHIATSGESSTYAVVMFPITPMS